MPVSDWNLPMNVSRNGAIALSWKEPMVMEPLAFLAPAADEPDDDDDEPPPQAARYSPVAPSAPRRIAWRRVILLLIPPSPARSLWCPRWCAPAPPLTRCGTRAPAARAGAARSARPPAARSRPALAR